MTPKPTRLHLVLGLFLLAILVVVSVKLRAQASTTCLNCAPTLLGNPNLSGNYNICFESNSTYSFGSTKESAMQSGITDNWNNYFSSANIGISFSFSTGSPCTSYDIKISLIAPGSMQNSGALAEATQTSNGHGAHVEVSGDQLGNGAVDWAEMAAHEIGHILGFDDVPSSKSSCAGQTVMWYQNCAMPSGAPTCSDKTSASGKYIGGNNDPGEYWQPSDECYEVYTVYRYWWFDGTDYHFSGWFLGQFQYLDCDNPPPY